MCPDTTQAFTTGRWKLKYKHADADHDGKFKHYEFKEHTQAKVGPSAINFGQRTQTETDMLESETSESASWTSIKKQRDWYTPTYEKRYTDKRKINPDRCEGACLGTNYRTDEVFRDSLVFDSADTLEELENTLNSQKWLTGGSTAWKSVQVYMSKLTANYELANELEPTSNWQGKFDTEAKVEDADENPIGPIGIEKKTPGSGISRPRGI